MKNENNLQAANLRNLIATGAFRFADHETPWFPYTSGQIGPYYVQSISVESDGAKYAFAVRSLVELIENKISSFDVISGGETRDWDFSNPVAVMMKHPHVKLYKDGRLLGAAVKGKRVLHVADLNNEGSSVRDYWKPIVERHGGRFIAIVSFVDRLEDGFALFKKMRLPSYSVVSLDKKAWDILLMEKQISAGLHVRLVARMKNRHQWAIDALLDNPAYFRKFYNHKSTREKAVKIMETYPEIGDKLKAMINAH